MESYCFKRPTSNWGEEAMTSLHCFTCLVSCSKSYPVFQLPRLFCIYDKNPFLNVDKYSVQSLMIRVLLGALLCRNSCCTWNSLPRNFRSFVDRGASDFFQDKLEPNFEGFLKSVRFLKNDIIFLDFCEHFSAISQ